ncbi:MAG TPA: PH domain-containing protein [Candidatus Magasanikbacteria bacterium]|nr:PH domain-containing protein [Candidatus Magasanikbacteria bacterium]
MSILLHPQEKVVRIYHRYGLTYFWYWLLVFIFVAAPFFFMFILFSWGNWGVGLFVASLVMAVIILIRTLFFWRTNFFLVTNERAIKVQRKGVLNKVVTDLNFFNIRSITYKVKGVFPTIFRYGKIVIETNEGKTIFEVNRLKKPAQIVNILAQIQQKQMQNGARPVGFEAILQSVKNETKENLLKLKDLVDKQLKELV